MHAQHVSNNVHLTCIDISYVSESLFLIRLFSLSLYLSLSLSSLSLSLSLSIYLVLLILPLCVCVCVLMSLFPGQQSNVMTEPTLIVLRARALPGGTTRPPQWADTRGPLASSHHFDVSWQNAMVPFPLSPSIEHSLFERFKVWSCCATSGGCRPPLRILVSA